jgi:hypothetical protein
VYDCEPLRGVAEWSLAWTVKLLAPLAAGVPLMSPPGDSDSPAGGVPDDSENV